MDRYFYKEDFILNNYGNIDWNLSKGIIFRVRNDKIIYKFKYLYKDNKNQKIHILYNDKEYTTIRAFYKDLNEQDFAIRYRALTKDDKENIFRYLGLKDK